ncbi:MAG: YlbF family regulator [Bacillota bacterium]
MIIDKARELGIALSESAEFTRMVETREALENDAATSEMLGEFRSKQEKMIQMLSDEESDREAVSALANDVENIQGMLLENPVFSNALDAQNDFQQLMNRVNSVISSCIGLEPRSGGGCGGSCSSCGGCVH